MLFAAYVVEKAARERMLMYRCCNVKRFFVLLLCDAIALGVLLVLFHGIGGATADGTGVSVPVLMYHSIAEESVGDYVVSPDSFEADLRYLRDHGYQTVFVEDLIRYVYDGTPLPQDPVVITFDDGFYNNLSVALPLLEQYDMKATISVVGSFAAEQTEQDSGKSYSYLTDDDLKRLLDSGRIEIGNHTYDLHGYDVRKGCARRVDESEAAYTQMLKTDLTTLQLHLQNEIGIEPVVFAYPYGSISRESIPVLRELGFLATLSCRELPNLITRDPDCLYGLNRYNRSGLVSTEEYMKRALQN